MPESKIKLRGGDVLVVDSLPGNVQLNALRRFLAEGFQTHLQYNTLLHQVCNCSALLQILILKQYNAISHWRSKMLSRRCPGTWE